MIGAPTFPDLSTLVVDDSLYVRRIVRDMLMRVGLRRIREASDGAEALGQIAEGRPDLVILDWDLPILSGEEVIRLIRDATTSPLPTVPLILMISQPRIDRIKRAVRFGVTEVVAKPFSPKSLWSRLDEVIHRPRPFTQVGSLLIPKPRAEAAA
jgi:CheY-like chemotaxis protein